VSYAAEIARVFDARDAEALAAMGLDFGALAADTWRDEMKSHGVSRTQAFGQRLAEAGYQGLLVRSFAPGAGPEDLNLVLWRWGDGEPARLTLIDDENRLGGGGA
jgi:RES domain-containing protein